MTVKVHSGNEAVTYLSGKLYADEANVVCPSCRSGHTHIRHVGTLVGADGGEAILSYDGTGTSGTSPARRSALEIVFTCEGCPKLFALVIQQHKGVNFIEIHEDVPELAE